MHGQRNPSPFFRWFEMGETHSLLLVKCSAQGPVVPREVPGIGHSQGILQVLQPNEVDASGEGKTRYHCKVRQGKNRL